MVEVGDQRGNNRSGRIFRTDPIVESSQPFEEMRGERVQ